MLPSYLSTSLSWTPRPQLRLVLTESNATPVRTADFRGDTELHDLDTRLLERMPATTLRCLGGLTQERKQSQTTKRGGIDQVRRFDHQPWAGRWLPPVLPRDGATRASLVRPTAQAWCGWWARGGCAGCEEREQCRARGRRSGSIGARSVGGSDVSRRARTALSTSLALPAPAFPIVGGGGERGCERRCLPNRGANEAQ